MKYDYWYRPDGVSSLTAEVLTEAIPWIKSITGTTLVIKYGGSAMEDPELRASVMSDILLLRIIGVNIIIVHGGGKAITQVMNRFEMPVEFVDGVRVTNESAMEVVQMVLTGQVNQSLVRAMNQHGNVAVGISGTDAGLIIAEQKSERLGRVGSITNINTPLLEDLMMDDYIPVLAPIAMGEDGGAYSINADVAAGFVAAAIGAHKILFLTDVDGLYENYPDPQSLISYMTVDDARNLLDSDNVSTGMIPKLESCVRALDAGVKRAHIINGKTPHSILLELLTNLGIGTTIVQPNDIEEFNQQPIGHFATKLRQDVDLTAEEEL